MPKLSKIRLTGCKYDGLRKEHENSIFDLTKEHKADHTLLTLFNGGGKGVMMQLIFQLLLPGTKWGKSNGNKVIGMFYDQRNNLQSFTFHVVLEWILDTVPEKRLINGIAVKSMIKNTGGEEEEKAGLSYFLYTHEHVNKGYYTVENLPLYDKEAKKTLDIDVLENFIDEHKRDFIKYSQSDVRKKDGRYYSYLESRGIYRSEWMNLKNMNKSEGGVGDYFTGANDNKSIFDKIILPAISENIRNYTYEEENSLIGMFKSNLSITKDLPILMKREGDYKDLLVEIKPLIENADSGSRFIDRKDRLISEGNDIYFILKDEENLVTQKVEEWSNELKKAEEEKKELVFQKDNLNYNQQRRKLEAKEKEVEALKKRLNEKTSEIKEKKETLQLFEINELLYAKKETEEKIDNKLQERQRLVEALDITDIKEKAKALDDEIALEWEKIKKRWKHHENQQQGYMNYTNGLMEEYKNRKKKYEARVKDLEKEINKFQLKEEELDKDRRKLENHYDPLSLVFPERILEDLMKSQREVAEKITTLSQQVEEYKDKITTLNVEIYRLEDRLDNKTKEVSQLQEEIKKQEEYELRVVRSLSKQLMENYDGSLLNHHWFSKKLEALEGMEEEKKQKLEEIQRRIWEKSIDKVLNKEDYFIPNKDILMIKEEIQKLGIHVETGSEYLKGLDSEAKLSIVQDCPGFIYSVVIGNEKEWQLIDKNIDKTLFFHNMVPIYIRSEMKGDNNSLFKTVFGKTYDLIDENNYIMWKEDMTNKIKGLAETENSIKEDLKRIVEIKQDLNLLLKNDTAWMLNEKLKEQQQERLEILEKISMEKEEKASIENNLTKWQYALEEESKKLGETKTSIQEMKTYIEKVEEVNREKVLISKTQKDLAELRERISTIEADIEGVENNQNTIKDAYNQWKFEVKKTIQEVKEIFHEVIYTHGADKNYLYETIPEFSVDSGQLMLLVKERKVLEEDLATKNSNIALLDKDIQHFRSELERHIDDLKKINENWESYPHLELTLNEMRINLRELNKAIKNLELEKQDVELKRENIRGSITTMKDQLEEKESQIAKEHKRTPIVLEVEDINSDIDRVERNIQSNKKYLALCTEELQKNQDRRRKLEVNLTKIKAGYPLEVIKGKMDEILKEKIQNNPDSIVETWLSSCGKNKDQISRTIEEGERFRSKFIKEINLKLEEDKLREKIITTVKEAKLANFKNNLSSFSSMEQHFQQELIRLSKDKRKAEDAMKKWTDRASIHIIRMVEALKSMVASMNYTNEQGYAFPLVKLKGTERLPKEDGEITYLLEEYFVQAIAKILEKKEEISNMEDKVFKDLMGDTVLFSKALQGRYPTLLVYKMSEKNEFRYARARDEYYTTWEAMNKGEGDLPEGSGGQTLSVNTFVIMMIMSFKKKHIGNENPSTVLVLDNPFGKASAKHVLDPIFEIADKLNFQLICFAAPEIIKVEISERFPVFWELKLEEGKVVHGGRIIK
ncbi:Chromosome segregation ATPase [Natronincola peptidivorans]|uniref:Chromosome segregation ATPase n=1 Tax=Natronincola peptidivorans TaxID=426128 RepID=A0A1I0H3N3_9FIRM|nr:hypothetical protein [Natronincola peptidivorans]SET78306.1 Chromosome segregation ATPase [Natronincola peptidivorans]